MKLTRRDFIMVVSIGVAISAVSWWLQKNEFPFIISGNENVGSSQPTIAAGDLAEENDFPITWNGDRPVSVDPKDYRLRIDGDISNPLLLTLEQLQAMPHISELVTIKCVEGWSASVRWEGVSLSHLLSVAGAPSGFDHVTVESITGYATKIVQADLSDSGIMVALKAESVQLPAGHGYPARLVIPTRSGYQWIKQVGRVTIART